MVNFPTAYSTFGAAEKAAVNDCLDRGQTTMGPKVREFEEKFAAYVGTAEAIMVNSGSSADLVMMLAARETGLMKVGDEIILPAVTWPTQAWAAIEAGFKVRLADVTASSLNASMSGATQARFVTHLMGNPSRAVRFHGGVLFEDCCEALGATLDGRKVGSFGKASAFSFFHSHHISTMEGGMICTSDPDFAECCRQLRAHGWVRDLRNPPKVKGDARFHFTGRGFNFRPLEISGAIGLVQLQRLPEFNYWRNRNREFLHAQIDPSHGNPIFHVEAETYTATPSWFAMPFILREDAPYSRAVVVEYLAERGIETRPIVGGNLARQPAFSEFRKLALGPLDNADVIHDRGFYIGLPPFEVDLWPVVTAFQAMDSILRGRMAVTV